MRSIHRIVIAAVLIVALAMPAAAASRRSPKTGNLVDAVKRFIVQVMTRISPPGGCPDTGGDETVTPPTDPPVKSQGAQE